MLKAFSWIFKHEDCKKHFIFLITMPFIITLLVALIIMILNKFLSSILDAVYLKFIYTMIILFPILFLHGYFWNLMTNIIERKEDITLSNIYGEKPKKEIIIELPELNAFKHIWRGFASFVATLFSFLPYYLLFFTTFMTGTALTSCLYTIPVLTISVYLIYIILLPALFWNYAKTNSVVAMLDIRKGFQIIHLYPKNYILTVLMSILVTVMSSAIDFTLSNIYSISIALTVVSAVIIYLKLIYLIFVQAYIIGTMLPIEEY